MIGPLPPSTATRLDKAARDNGFDLGGGDQDGWLVFASSQSPMRLWLGALGDELLVAAFSDVAVGAALGGLGTPLVSPLPAGAAAARSVADMPAMHRLLRRAFQLSRALPDKPLKVFEAQVAGLPRATEAERLVVQRVGQEVFRQGLLDYWQGRCALSGLAVPELLRASHIRPWADCASDAERLDVFNGILLAAHLDAAFDRGFLSLADDGLVLISAEFDDEARGLLGLVGELRVVGLTEQHRHYLPWHREHVFRGSQPTG